MVLLLQVPPLSPHVEMLFLLKGPTFTADTVLGRDGFLLGAEASYNVTEARVTKYSAALGFSAPEYAVTFHGLSNLSTFAASYYHRVSPDVEAGAKAVYDTNATSPAVALEVGTKAYVHCLTRPILAMTNASPPLFSVTSTLPLSSRLRSTMLVSSLSVGVPRAFDLFAIIHVILRLGYTQALRPGVKASFGLALDTQRLNDAGHAGPAHKVGAQFVFEA